MEKVQHAEAAPRAPEAPQAQRGPEGDEVQDAQRAARARVGPQRQRAPEHQNIEHTQGLRKPLQTCFVLPICTVEALPILSAIRLSRLGFFLLLRGTSAEVCVAISIGQ